MNWIRQERRLAIYLRDGMACAWCGDSVENGAILTLDHLVPHSKGGSNDSANLVCSCKRCNSSRGNRSLKVFAEVIAAYLNHGTTGTEILAHVRRTSKRVVKLAAAKDLIAQRGSVARVLSPAFKERK